MIRCMMLALTLILITLSAAFLGRDGQIRQVLHQTKLPVQSSVESYPQPQSSSTSSPSDHSSESPRFIPDEPISQQPAESHHQSAPPFLPDDPSAEAQLYPIENAEDYTPTPPTEQQKLIAAEPFVKELFELTEQSADELRAIIDRAIGEFLSASPLERNNTISALIEKYTPEIISLEEKTDSKAEAILLRMNAALVAIGADDSLVTDARAAYEHSKQQQISHYTELFSTFIPQ